jgi:hypothetical protein
MEYVIAVVLGAIGSLIAAEIYAGARVISVRLIDWAVTRFTNEAQARFREEWHAHLVECVGNLSGLLHALGCVRYAVVFSFHSAYEEAIRKVLEATLREITLSLTLLE